MRSLRAAPGTDRCDSSDGPPSSSSRACLRGETSALQADGSGATPDLSTPATLELPSGFAGPLCMAQPG